MVTVSFSRVQNAYHGAVQVERALSGKSHETECSQHGDAQEQGVGKREPRIPPRGGEEPVGIVE